MQDRLLSLFGAALSFFLVIVLIAPPGDPGARETSLPTSEDRGSHGLLGLKTWLEHNRVRTLGLRKAYSALRDLAQVPAAGNLLILSLPHTAPADEAEIGALHAWLNAGNSALVLAAQSDSPPWTLQAERDSGANLLAGLGLALDTPETEAGEQTPLPDTYTAFRELLAGLQKHPVALRPALAHPLTDGVASVEGVSYPALNRRDWRLSAADGGHIGLRLLVEAGSKHTGLWEIPLGGGRVWLSAYADLLGNLSLGRADNAKLLGNLLAAALGEDGYVLFDDFHFGLTDLYDPDSFFSDPRLHNTLLFFGAFWLLYLLGYSNRLAPPQPAPRRIHAVDFVQAGAGLFARRLSPVSVARGLLGHFHNEVRARYRLPPSGEPVWEVLDAHPKLPRREVRRLRELAERIEQGRAPELVEFSRLLHSLRNHLQ